MTRNLETRWHSGLTHDDLRLLGVRAQCDMVDCEMFGASEGVNPSRYSARHMRAMEDSTEETLELG